MFFDHAVSVDLAHDFYFLLKGRKCLTPIFYQPRKTFYWHALVGCVVQLSRYTKHTNGEKNFLAHLSRTQTTHYWEHLPSSLLLCVLFLMLTDVSSFSFFYFFFQLRAQLCPLHPQIILEVASVPFKSSFNLSGRPDLILNSRWKVPSLIYASLDFCKSLICNQTLSVSLAHL